MLELKSLASAETFVAEQQSLGNQVKWDGWDIEFFQPDIRAYQSVNGFYNGTAWGFINKSPVTSKGTWLIDNRNVKRS